jgi:hypothetical protein
MTKNSERLRQRAKAQESHILQMQGIINDQQTAISRIGEVQKETQERFLVELKRREEDYQQARQADNERMERKLMNELTKLQV